MRSSVETALKIIMSPFVFTCFKWEACQALFVVTILVLVSSWEKWFWILSKIPKVALNHNRYGQYLIWDSHLFKQWKSKVFKIASNSQKLIYLYDHISVKVEIKNKKQLSYKKLISGQHQWTQWSILDIMISSLWCYIQVHILSHNYRLYFNVKGLRILLISVKL